MAWWGQKQRGRLIPGRLGLLGVRGALCVTPSTVSSFSGGREPRAAGQRNEAAPPRRGMSVPERDAVAVRGEGPASISRCTGNRASLACGVP